MSIAIDIREADTTGAGKARYCEEITHALIKEAPEDTEFILFSRTPKKNFPNSPRVQQILIPGKSIFWHFNLRRYLIMHPVDIFIAPTSYIYPAIAPKFQRIAIVVHDTIAFTHARGHALFPTLVERLTLGHAVKNSDFIITVSKNTANDLKKLTKHKKPVVIAAPAVNTDFKPTNDKAMNLPDSYILAVGTLSPRKNLTAVFEAFEQLAPLHADLHLVIVGGKGWKTKSIFKLLPKAFRDRIHFLGYVPHKRLAELYSRAQVLAFPSLYEGFGIPPLEAMACGCPVVTSNAASLPEVVGNAALQVYPTDSKALAQAIKKLLSPKMRNIYKELGLKRAALFSWSESAQKILNQI